jgi:sensor histidine kinase YesM
MVISGTYVIFKWRVGVIRKEEKIKTTLNQKMAQLEMKALRAQMNPHFVFNSLSSIQESVVTGKTDAASKYLSKFSRLIRLILENSGKQFIPLKAEVDSLTLYLELESFRFENFTYTISIDPLIDAAVTMVPSMVIQPFVENALKHGLSRKKEDKHLKIDIRKEQGQVVATVEDNGIGRAKAEEMKSLEKKDHHSMGIEITKERLQLLGQQTMVQATVITDLYNSAGNACGTLVKIILPVEN